MVPRLLVSVRDRDEARSAIQGGADIIDVKEPQRGSLGMADPDAIASVLDVVQAEAPGTPVSVALGELVQWPTGAVHSLPAVVRSHSLPAGSGTDSPPARSWQWVKAGLSETSRDGSLTIAWKTRWQQLLAELALPSPRASRGGRAAVAVCYADGPRCAAPSPDAVVDAAVELGCGAVLLDTCVKDGSHLLDWLPPAELLRIGDRCRAEHLRFALAGRICESQLSELRALQPDIVAVRGAVCEGNDRRARVTRQRVRDFRRALHAQFA